MDVLTVPNDFLNSNGRLTKLGDISDSWML